MGSGGGPHYKDVESHWGAPCTSCPAWRVTPPGSTPAALWGASRPKTNSAKPRGTRPRAGPDPVSLSPLGLLAASAALRPLPCSGPPRPGLLHCAPPGAVAGPPELAMLACVQAARAHGRRPRATRKTPTRLKGPSCDATGHTWRGGRRGAEVAGVSAAPLTQPATAARAWGASAHWWDSAWGRRLGPAEGWGQEDASASSREWGPKGFAPQLQTASEDPRSHAGGLAPITTSRTSRVRWFLWNLNPLHVAAAAANFPAKNKTYSSTKASTWAPCRAGLGSRPPPPRGTPHKSGCSWACSSFIIFWI